MRFSGSLAFIPLFIVVALSFADAGVIHRNGSTTHKSKNNKAHKFNSKPNPKLKLDNINPSCNGSPTNCGLHLMQGYVFPGTHNSGTSALDPNPALGAVSILRPLACTTECQNSDIGQQFKDGIRAFHLELCDALDAKHGMLFDLFQKRFANPVPAYTDDDPVICHGTEPLWGYGPLLSVVFQDLQNALSQSNNQVIRIVLEFRQGDTTKLLDTAVKHFTRIFCGGNQSCPVAVQFSELYNQNPTLGSLTANGANRIIFVNPSLTYYPTDGSLPAAPGTHYSVPWVLQDYLACNYDTADEVSEILAHQVWECKTDAAASLCTYYGQQDQIIYRRPVPWKIQGQTGFSINKLECIASYANDMNQNTAIVASVPICQQNNINLGQVEIDYYDSWSNGADPGGYVRWINRVNSNTSSASPWGSVY